MKTVKAAGNKVQLVSVETAAKKAAQRRRPANNARLLKAKDLVAVNKASKHSYAEQAEHYAKLLKDKAPDKPGMLSLAKWLVTHMENGIAIGRMPDKADKKPAAKKTAAKKAATKKAAAKKAAKSDTKNDVAAAPGPFEQSAMVKSAGSLLDKALRSKDITPARAKNLVDKIGASNIALALDKLSTSALGVLVKKLDTDKAFGYVYNYPLSLSTDDKQRLSAAYKLLGINAKDVENKTTLDHVHVMKVATSKGHPFVGHQIYISAAKAAISEAIEKDKKAAAKRPAKGAAVKSTPTAQQEPAEAVPTAYDVSPTITNSTPASKIPVGMPEPMYPVRGAAFAAILNKPNLESYFGKQLRAYADRANADLHDDRRALEANRALLADINKDLTFALQFSGHGVSAVSSTGYPALIEAAGTGAHITGGLDAIRARVLKRIANGEAAKTEPISHATLAARHTELVDAVGKYLAEYDSPVPDYELRQRYRTKLRDLVSQPISSETFDPFEVGVVARVKEAGASATHEAIAKLVAGDADAVAVEKIKAIAKAQHLDIPNDLDGREACIAAIVSEAVRKLANRRSAAS